MDPARELEQDLGRRVRAVRLARDLTQQQVADRANVSVGALKHLESGAGATIRTLVRVLRALDQTSWLDALSPPAPTFSPLEALRTQQRQQAEAARPRRASRRTGT